MVFKQIISGTEYYMISFSVSGNNPNMTRHLHQFIPLADHVELSGIAICRYSIEWFTFRGDNSGGIHKYGDKSTGYIFSPAYGTCIYNISDDGYAQIYSPPASSYCIYGLLYNRQIYEKITGVNPPE